ncbi:phage portal protein [Natrononativus amylolyticus]|uniref:phage portal protein n=1 Tax=Natrononativus amylolyticus TaxID=2963434 RepID=UPI0020CB94CE|nr:phage portal protein [Natrononativus amylolyticus]
MSTRTPGIYTEISKGIRTKAEETQQLQDRAQAVSPGGARSPPVDPVVLSRLLEENTTHAKCCYVKARNVAGYGFDLVPHPETDSPSEEQRETAEEFWFGDNSVWQVGPDHQERATATDVLQMGWLDYEAVGWLTLEPLIQMDGTPVGMAWVPAMTVRKRRTHDNQGNKVAHGYVQLIDGNSRYFGVAGDRYADEPIFVDTVNGSFGTSVDNPATELIFKRNASPLHRHYGTPDIIPARRAVRGKKAAEEYNIQFFENDAVPRMAVIIEGGELTDKAFETLDEIINESASGGSHRTLLLEVERLAQEPGMMNLQDGYDAKDVSIRIEPMTVGTEEDASFLGYQDHTEHDILQAHEVPPVVGNVLKSGAFSTDTDDQRKEFADSVIGPKQENYAGLLYETIHKPLGVTDWIIDFKTRGLENRVQELEMAATRIEASQGVLTVNQILEELGFEPRDDPIGQEMLLNLGGQPGGVTASIEQTIHDEITDAKEDLRSDLTVERHLENVPGDDGP